ncbi:hypothetical protein [Amycolatopsis sp. DSM 110486]|uniref:effector-associated constant component EACC1 n=1 Tax=Amycolatopsis sp. DSM 110486 TaxID=2865832 RepID=UPI001C697708|nr:hypothetical protein [Amycolatopsis sp. DSM 110486]QYN18875.1 hypothetical protein K1T34_40205 [Amycolatopsis sp. DSM 110486]
MPVINQKPGDAHASDPSELHLVVRGHGEDSQLRALREWLLREDDLRGCLELRNRPVGPDQMGGVLDLLAVTLGTGGAGVVLAQSLSTWLTQRRTDVTVTVKAQDGREVSVDVRRALDPQAVIREVASLVEPVED